MACYDENDFVARGWLRQGATAYLAQLMVEVEFGIFDLGFVREKFFERCTDLSGESQLGDEVYAACFGAVSGVMDSSQLAIERVDSDQDLEVASKSGFVEVDVAGERGRPEFGGFTVADGCCYLALVRAEHRDEAWRLLGEDPQVQQLLLLDASWFEDRTLIRAVVSVVDPARGVYHVALDGVGCGLLGFFGAAKQQGRFGSLGFFGGTLGARLEVLSRVLKGTPCADPSMAPAMRGPRVVVARTHPVVKLYQECMALLGHSFTVEEIHEVGVGLAVQDRDDLGWPERSRARMLEVLGETVVRAWLAARASREVASVGAFEAVVELVMDNSKLASVMDASPLAGGLVGLKTEDYCKARAFYSLVGSTVELGGMDLAGVLAGYLLYREKGGRPPFVKPSEGSRVGPLGKSPGNRVLSADEQWLLRAWSILTPESLATAYHRGKFGDRSFLDKCEPLARNRGSGLRVADLRAAGFSELFPKK